MASKYIQDLRSKGLAVNDHGISVSTVEQSGSYAGESVGRVWWNQPNIRGASRWHWISCDSLKDAFLTASTLKGLTYDEIMEKY
jgi:hypothetical protein